MTEEEFDAFRAAAWEELARKQDVLRDQYGLGSFSRWHFDQTTAALTFFDAGGNAAIEFDVVDIGSYSTKSQTWKWAWSNESVLAPLREDSAILKGLESMTGLSLFGRERAFKIQSEAMAWELAAISVQYLGALGCYRAPVQAGPLGFLAIMRVRTPE